MNDFHQNNLIPIIQPRLPLFESRNAVRLAHFGELPAKITVDYYNTHILITDYQNLSKTKLDKIATGYTVALKQLNLELNSITAKSRPDNLSRAEMKYTPLLGQSPPDKFTVTENNMTFEVSFTDAGFGTGLFLDMATGRQFIKQHTQPDDHVLNLFSYTGAFSIAAGTAGAQQIIEVDTYARWLNYSKQNQSLNNITTVKQRKEDAVKYTLKQKDNSFNIIICDPPSFAKPKKGKSFRIEDGYKTLRSHFQRILRPGGILFACCNHDKISMKEFQSWLPSSLKKIDTVDPSPDFPNATYLKIVVLQKK